MAAHTIARITYSGQCRKPLVLRRIEVPFEIRLDRLHEALQAAMGWNNSHLYKSAPVATAGVPPILIGPTDPGERYPRLLEASGRCPPEDVGGPPGYAESLEALKDPQHPRHDEYMEWMPENFDAAFVDIQSIADEPTKRSKAN
jgi:hypothetical protein